MAVTTKCLGEKCLLKHECQRFTATPSQMQSYAMFDNIRVRQYGDTPKCDFFLPIGEQDDKEQQEL